MTPIFVDRSRNRENPKCDTSLESSRGEEEDSRYFNKLSEHFTENTPQETTEASRQTWRSN